MSTLKLYLLGPPRVELDGVPVDIQRRKVLALLIYLAVNEKAHSRDILATLFWPDHDQKRARAYLRRDLALLNKSLAGVWLETDREMVELKRGSDLATGSGQIFWMDVAEFRRLVAACQSHDHATALACADCLPFLTKAAELYTDDFLAGFTLRDSPGFDDWQFFQAESLRQELASLLERLVSGHSAQEDYEAAINYARRWVGLDPFHEPAQRELIKLYDLAGQISAALRQYEEFSDLLEEEFGVPPEDETATLYEAIKAKRLLGSYIKTETKRSKRGEIYQRSSAPRPPQTSVPSGQIGFRHNLPSQLTPFIGREKELAEIKRLLLQEPACRLLTLVGPGGIGKTRLATQAAQALVDDPAGITNFRHGILFVSLASANAASDMVSTIAEAANLNFYSNTPLKQQLLDYLREKQILFVLDDCEHLLAPPASHSEEGLSGGVDIIAEILATASGVKMLVTSREALNLQEAWFYPIGGMPVPPPLVSPARQGEGEWEEYDAVRLFEQNARRARIGFTLATERDHVTRICRLVDGIPLAIELAAAWLKVLTAEDVANEIENSLDILTTRYQNVPQRHRSMRVVLEQSWVLLDKEEREVLKKLSVFQGGFFQDAAEQIAGASLFMLAALVEKSLLRRDAAGRYHIHELLRQFADEKLRETAGDKEQAQAQHGGYYAAFLEQREKDVQAGQQQTALAEIAGEIENVRASWRWAVSGPPDEAKKIEALDKALDSLFHFYDMRSRFEEGEAALDRAATFLDKATDKRERIILGKILGRQGWFTFHLGQHHRGKARLQQSLDILRSLEAETDMIFSLNYLGAVNRHMGHYDLAQKHLQESLVICRKIGDQYGLTIALNILGQIAYLQGEYAEAKWFCQESLAVKCEIADQWGMTFSLTYLGTVAKALGDYEEAKHLFQESLAISDLIGDRRGEAISLNNVGDAVAALGEYDEAQKLYQKSLTIFGEIGYQLGVITALTNLGKVYCSLGDYKQAQQQFQAALEMALANRVMPKVLEVFAGVAELWLEHNKRKQALEALSLVANHPASNKEIQDKAVHMLSELSSQPLAETITPIQPDEQDRRMDAIIREIMP